MDRFVVTSSSIPPPVMIIYPSLDNWATRCRPTDDLLISLIIIQPVVFELEGIVVCIVRMVADSLYDRSAKKRIKLVNEEKNNSILTLRRDLG